MDIDKNYLLKIIKQALDEDIGDGDVTTNCIIPETAIIKGKFIAKESGVIAGLKVVEQTFLQIDSRVRLKENLSDGERIKKGVVIGTVEGPGKAILCGERVALNFLQRMSGIATITSRFVETVQGTSAVILDTRKTVPRFRLLDKWAVKIGGGQNHRIGLYDMVLIKDNHITAAGGITQAVRLVRARDERKRKIEVEVKNLHELREALELNVDQIMLDNMTLEEMEKAVVFTVGRIPLEASGNVNLDNVTSIAQTGVDFISVGMLTHSVKALDISLLLS
ncbi:carboxylating nicotinate-nucleotide diphosphorylase [candidate division KSB1 bacterium]|nr:carboxylating nicotinate-nucleotide diphosphorylase [candidate division KSB1 bacterium]